MHPLGQIEPHEHCIFNRISIVGPAEAHFAKADADVKRQSRVIRRTHLKSDLKHARFAQFTQQGVEEHAAKAASLASSDTGSM